MDDARPVRTGSRVRGFCALAGLLCALGVVSAAVVRANDGAHHRSPSLAAAALVADGHGLQVRADDAVAGGAVGVTLLERGAAVATTDSVAAVAAQPDEIRTRGPPATA